MWAPLFRVVWGHVRTPMRGLCAPLERLFTNWAWYFENIHKINVSMTLELIGTLLSTQPHPSREESDSSPPPPPWGVHHQHAYLSLGAPYCWNCWVDKLNMKCWRRKKKSCFYDSSIYWYISSHHPPPPPLKTRGACIPLTWCSRVVMTDTAEWRMVSLVWALSCFRCSWHIRPSSLNASLMSRTRMRSLALLAWRRSFSLTCFCSEG